MHETTTPPIVPASAADNLTALVLANAREAPDAVGFLRAAGDGWEPVTHATFLAEVDAVAKGLVAAGVGPGDRVALMARTRYEWTLVDFAVWSAGAVVVPVYETSSAEQVRWILSDSGARAVVVETGAHADVVAGVRADLPALEHVWCLDTGGLGTLTDAGRTVPDEELDTRRSGLDAAAVATLIYTSGTTGRPKGCRLTHGNFLELARNTSRAIPEVVRAEGARTLLFLPLAHVFARFVEVLCVEARVTLAHAPDVRRLVEDLASVRPTFVLAVPRVFEKIYNGAEAAAEGEGHARIFRMAAATAVAWSEAQDTGGPGPLLRLRRALFDRIVYTRLRARLGGSLAYAVSGGAPLAARLAHFFRGAGITVLEGYGLTETTAPSTVNRPGRQRIGSVGFPLPGVTIGCAEDGEILVRGVNVMVGYHGDPPGEGGTGDGWLHTGDLGEIDADGFLWITGRKKEIIVTAGGKNVVPTTLEDRLRTHPLVSQCIVVGDQRPFVGCLVTLDAEMLPTWLANRGRPPLDVAAAAVDPEVRAAVGAAIDEANTAVSKAESIRKFLVLDTDFTEADGHLTPKMSLKRSVILAQFADRVEELYS